MPDARVTGVTLPGTPAVVAGSNGSVAWGFTNAYIDTGDLVEVEVNRCGEFSVSSSWARWSSFRSEERKETIRVKGDDDVVVDYTWTIWGPVVGVNERRAPLAHRMVAHDPDVHESRICSPWKRHPPPPRRSRSRTAPAFPRKTILIADKAGEIAWTIAGRLPKRVGYDGRLPVTWTFGDRKWDGYLSPRRNASRPRQRVRAGGTLVVGQQPTRRRGAHGETR